MSPVIGVDTFLDFRAQVQAGLTVWADACAWLGAKPKWVSRPIGTGGGAATPLSAGEVSFLHGQGVAILPYFNDSVLNGSKPPAATYALGVQEAAQAIAEANKLGVPDNTYVALAIENNAPVTGDYVRGWCDTIRASRLAGSGMIYGIITPGSRLAQALGDALAADQTGNLRRLYLWSSRWTVGTAGTNAANAPAWDAGGSPAIAGQVHAWQYSGNDFDDVVDEDELDAALLAPGGGLWDPPAAAAAKPTPQPTALPATVPSWAAPSVRKAISKGVVTDPAGGADFYRSLVVMDRLGLL